MLPALVFVKFGVGQSVARTEDPILLRGEGCHTDDINLAGQAHAVMVRSRIAHAAFKDRYPRRRASAGVLARS